ncbi:MAG: hypothetical protein JW860_07600 [Sedimentisphaerales bacterium]|nr:hypothetical protein [Sedimentisphaerales bacterium]
MKKTGPFVLIIALLGGALLCSDCDRQNQSLSDTDTRQKETSTLIAATPLVHENQNKLTRPRRKHRVIHVYVALCDNQNQGIVPVPASLGNGQDPANNLYWGAMYGVKGYFRRQKTWEPVRMSSYQIRPEILEQIAFKKGEVFLIAQAYDGATMKTILVDFLNAAAGQKSNLFIIGQGDSSIEIQAGALADMVCFVGHNGLMDFQLDRIPEQGSGDRPECAVVLACQSQSYFSPLLHEIGCQPLITTTGLMAPEAYTLEAIVDSWSAGYDETAIHNAAAQAYAKYQKCSLNAAKRLFTTN